MNTIIFGWVSLLILSLFGRLTDVELIAGNTCSTTLLDQEQISPQAGKLVFVGNVDGTFEPFIVAPDEISMVNGALSPTGDYVASYMVTEDNIFQTVVFNNQGEVIYMGTPTQARIRRLAWLSNEVLAFISSGLEGQATYFQIDPFRQQYVHVTPATGFSNHTDSEESFFYHFFQRLNFATYDGRYWYDLENALYDFTLQRPLTVNNFRPGIPSSSSHQIIGIDYDHQEDGNDQVYVFDFDTDTLTYVATLPQAAFRRLDDTSWSFDQRWLAYAYDYSSGAEETRFRRIELLHLDGGEIIPTCLGMFFELREYQGTAFVGNRFSTDFAWSRDSRYLALQGVLEGEDPDESLGVYIYDTQTSDIYEVYRGRADIIGWMAHPDS